jgi:phenylacetate-CoA ligase
VSVQAQTMRSRFRRAGWNYVYGEDFFRVQSLVWTSQWWSRPQIERFQWDRILKLVRHARNESEFYRGRLKDIDPLGISPETFTQIPALTRSDVVTAGAAIGAGADGPRTLRRHSGGSSGLSVSIPLDRATYAWYPAGLGRGLRWWGSDLMERGVLLVGTGSTGWRALATRAKDWMMTWMRLPVRDDFEANTEGMLAKIHDFEPDFIYGYPSAVDSLARKMESTNSRFRRPPKVIVLTGEPVYGFQRARISDRWGAPVAEEYGCGEVGTVGFQCPIGTLHAAEENVFTEASEGKLLATHLHNLNFPLIRYDTGDLGTIAPSACGCGRAHRAIALTGRARDRLMGPNGPIQARQILDQLFAALPQPTQGRVQVVHRRAGSVVLQVERGTGINDWHNQIGAISRDILGPDWHVSIAETPFLQRLPSGKLPYFIRRA